jgi:hypothetical protein
VYWIEKASAILWENTCGVISQTTMEKLHNSLLSTYSRHDSWDVKYIRVELFFFRQTLLEGTSSPPVFCSHHPNLNPLPGNFPAMLLVMS